MATFTITVPANQTTRVIDAISSRFRYAEFLGVDPGTGTPIPNPESRVDFVKRMIKKSLRAWVLNWEGQVAQANAIDNAADTGIDIA